MPDPDQLDPSTTSPGNPGARGSTGRPNRGAGDAESTNCNGERAPEPSTDLRDAEAQGSGGAGSDSSRSQ